MQLLATLDIALARFLKACVLCAVVALFFLLFFSIAGRQISLSFSGPLEYVEFLFIWVILLTVVILWRENDLYRVSLIDSLHPRVQIYIALFVEILKLLFCVLIAWQGYKYAVGMREVTPFLQIDKGFAYGSIPICGVLMGMYSVRNIVVNVRKIFTGSNSLDPMKGGGKHGSI